LEEDINVPLNKKSKKVMPGLKLRYPKKEQKALSEKSKKYFQV
jgi:hypothetical protein